jgi:hypothetical protein
MADNGIGYSFQPGAQNIPLGGNRATGGPQSAVQVKSFTLPNRFVPGQIAPQALLQSPGGGGGLNVDILRRLMQMFAPQGQQPGVPALGQPQTSLGGSPMSMIPPATTQPTFHTQPVPNPNQPVPGHWVSPPTPAQPEVPLTSSPGAPPRVIPGGGQGNEGNPYTNPANYAPAPAEPIAPITLPAPEGYHFGTTPPAPDLATQTPHGMPVNPLKSKFDDYEGFTF